jgi:hypothetical protein
MGNIDDGGSIGMEEGRFESLAGRRIGGQEALNSVASSYKEDEGSSLDRVILTAAEGTLGKKNPSAEVEQIDLSHRDHNNY